MNEQHMAVDQLIDEMMRLKSQSGQPPAKPTLPCDQEDSFIALLLDTVPTGVSIVDADDLHYVFVNRRGIEIYGMDPTDTSLDAHLQQIKIFRPDGLTPFRTDELPLMQTLATGEMVHHCEMVIEQPSGRRLSIMVNSAPFHDETGAIRLILVGFMDVTRMKQAERDIQDTHEQTLALVKALEKADSNKNRYLNMLSHELRNPLAAIVLGQSLLKRLPEDSEQSRRIFDMLDRQTAQLTRLVDDLLEVTRINENRIMLKKTVVNLVDIVRETMSDFDAQFSAKHVAYRAALPSEPINLSIDRARMAQALGNILHNALKFTAAGDDVMVTVRRKGRHAIINVRDTGVGIPSSLLPELFTPFSQADMSLDRSQGGLGLGLAITKGLIALHGGSVEAHSDGPGKGAEFTIRLPLADCPATCGSCLLE